MTPNSRPVPPAHTGDGLTASAGRGAVKPIMLDLFCGEGGAAEGYRRAGWDVVCVDHDPRRLSRNPFPSYCADALRTLHDLLMGWSITVDGRVLRWGDFAAVHASPPCQGYTIATAGNLPARRKYRRLISETRDLLKFTHRPWVIENVEQARSQMVDPILLCGRMFGLNAFDEDWEPLVLDRHRLFESSVPLIAPAHPMHGGEQVGGVYGGSRRAKRLPGESLAEVAPRDRHAARYERKGGYVPRSKRVLEGLLGIDWMSVKGLHESIPPAYSEYLGDQLMLAHILGTAA